MKLLHLLSLGAVWAKVDLDESAMHDLERQRLIDLVNNNEKALWTAGHNERFKGKPVGYAKNLCGAKETPRELIESEILAGNLVRAANITGTGDELPDTFDSKDNWPQCSKVIGEIRDQSDCGCCWAFGAAEAASDRMCIATNATMMYPLSAQDMCFCAETNGCNGGMLYSAWRHIKSSGLVTGGMNDNTDPSDAMGGGWCSKFSLPHCHHHGPKGSDPYPNEGQGKCKQPLRSPACPRRCDEDAQAPHNKFDDDKYSFSGPVTIHPSNSESIMRAIMSDGPVEAAFTVYADFENYSSGIYHHVSGQTLGGHAIRIVGWGQENGVPYWKVANSWNSYWGENGYFRIVRGKDECGIESNVVSSTAGAKWDKMSEIQKMEM